jgi:type III restriction enzyme
LEERATREITFPRLTGYRFEFTEERLTAAFSEKSKLPLSTADVPTKTENAPIVGEGSIHTLDDLKKHRPQEVAFRLAKVLLEEKFRDDGGSTKAWLFPQLLGISKRWLIECVICKDNTFPQMLLLHEQAYKAVERIYTAIVASTHQDKILKPILRPFETVGTTRYVDFDTIRDTYDTRPDKCHINRVVGDTKSWEQKLAQTLEDMDEVTCYAKNDHVGFTIPYTFNGQEENYRPDFIARINDGHVTPASSRPGDVAPGFSPARADLKVGATISDTAALARGTLDPLNLILEVTGARDEKKATKVSTAQDLWVPAVNNHGGFGRWAFLEIADPWDAANTLRAYLAAESLA